VRASGPAGKLRTDERSTTTTVDTTTRAPSSRTAGFDIDGDTASENETDVESVSDMASIHPKDLDLSRLEVPQDVVDKASEEADRKGVGRSIREGIEGDVQEALFEGVDRAKPTRLYSDILPMAEFGHEGWPQHDSRDNYLGPLPRHCGHDHRQAMIGRSKSGGFHTSPTAAYPAGMCAFIANRIFDDCVKNIGATKGGVRASGPAGKLRTDERLKNVSMRSSSPSTTSPISSTMVDTTTRTPSSRTAGFDFNGDTASENKTDVESVSDMAWIHPKDLDLNRVEVPQDEVDKASEEADRKGVGRPIREGIEGDVQEALSEDETHDPTERLPKDAEDIASTSEEERELPGTRRPKRGEGWWGRGEALRPYRKGTARDFVDGAGLPSPGRWPVERRRLPEPRVADRLRKSLKKGLIDIEKFLPGGSLKATLARLSRGGLTESPFPETKRGREDPGQPQEDPRAGGFRGWLAERGGPDSGDGSEALARAPPGFRGSRPLLLRVVVSRSLVRVSREAFAQSSGPLRAQDQVAVEGRLDAAARNWRTNYSSVRDHEAQVEKQYDDEVKEGLTERITLGEALERYDEKLVIAATGAIAKRGAEPGGDIRVMFDGTNGVYLNLGIRIRDEVRSPTACDIKAVLAEVAEEGGVHWSLLFDVSKAHRRIPVLEEEWCRQA
jgi:hypothetical protein